MPYPRIERVEDRYSPAALANETPVLYTVPPGWRAIGFSARVATAGDGTETLSFGKTGAVTAFMTTANVGITVAGRKVTAAGADLAGNGTLYSSATNVVADFVAGTGTIIPVVHWVLLLIRDDAWDDLIVG